MTNLSILALDTVSLTYNNGKTFILRDISFSVRKWEILSIIGINGSGKSSLLKVIAGIISPSAGNITKSYQNLSYVPQKMNLDKTFPIKVYEYIQIYNDQIQTNSIKSYLEKFSSEYLYNKNIGDLSGWELQKVLIISALISEPDIILLDEPTAGIDIIGEEIFYEIIREVKKIFPNIAIILVSHNIHLVYKHSDAVICLHENNFCCHGTPMEVAANDITKSIFWEYTLPYLHHPHKEHHHIH